MNASTNTQPRLGGEVRTTSSTGGEKGVKPERYDLVPVEALEELARVYAFGATKYADHNWRRGYEWSKAYAAGMRHFTAFWRGEELDPESGLSHLAHAMFHLCTLLVFAAEQRQFDDRWTPDEDPDPVLDHARDATYDPWQGVPPLPVDDFLKRPMRVADGAEIVPFPGVRFHTGL